MAGPRKKPRKGELSRVPIFFSSELVDALDRLSEQLAAERLTGEVPRAEAVRVLVVEGLRKRGLLK